MVMLHALLPTFEPVLHETNQVVRSFYVGGKARNIAIELVWSKVAKQVARFLLPVSSVP